jgi:lysophospholipase L1-like esterase
MLGPDGRPRGELFRMDGLHLSPEGYAVWTDVVRPPLEADFDLPGRRH